jgi:hypothetical protein
VAPRLALVVVLAAAACGEPKPFDGQIPIVPGAAARAMAIMQRGAEPDAGVETPRATAHVMRKGEELGGASATGRPGDSILANAEVVFVEREGVLVDAADAHVRRDELGQMATSLGGSARQVAYDATTSGEGADGSAWIEVRGHELHEAGLVVVTRYTLQAADRALLVTTKIENASDHPMDHVVLGDSIAWGATETIAPGKEPSFVGPSTGAYLGGVGRFVSYALASTDGDLTATTDAAGSVTAMTPETTLSPGQTADTARAFAVGKRGDTASVIAELTQMAGGEVGEIAIDLVGDDAKRVPAPAGAKVVFFGPRGDPLFFMRAASDGDPLGGELPPGHYALSYDSGGGRSASGARVEVDIDARKLARATLRSTTVARGP